MAAVFHHAESRIDINGCDARFVILQGALRHALREGVAPFIPTKRRQLCAINGRPC